MANRQIGIILRQLQKLLERQPESDLSDAQLLRRFVHHHDEAAFELLVQRHGRLVWGVCRHVLHDDHDAEDAFQGTFLVLARKAGSIRNQNAVGSWLYGVAYRIARKARLAASRRRTHESRVTPPVETNTQSDLAWRELQAILDEELSRLADKYRAPFVLCCLQGKSKKEAAGELGWKEGTVSSRLAQARKLLQKRLSRRGVTLSALLCGTALAQEPATAAVPARLVATTGKAALAFLVQTGARTGPASEQAVFLARDMLKAMAASKSKFGVALLAAMTVVGAGAGMILRQPPTEQGADAVHPSALRAHGLPGDDKQNPEGDAVDLGARQKEEAGLDPEGAMTVRGRVLDASGQPLAGADVTVVAADNRQAGQLNLLPRADRKVLGSGRSDNQGRFDLSVQRTSLVRHFGPGVIVSSAGYGLGWYALPFGQSVHEIVCSLEAGQAVHGRLIDPQGRPAAHVQVHVAGVKRGQAGGTLLFIKAPPAELRRWPAPVTSDEQGNFLLRDISPDCAIDLQVLDDRYAPQWLAFRTGKKESNGPVSFVLAPRRIVGGTVICEDTGQAIPHANVFVDSFGGDSARPSRTEGQTDAHGRFQIAAYPGKVVSVTAFPARDTGYLVLGRDTIKWPQGASSLQVDFALPRGVLVSGRIVEEPSGRPVPWATVAFRPRLEDNRYLRPNRPGGDIQSESLDACTASDGSFQLPVPPGPGWLVVKGPTPDYVHTEISARQLQAGKVGGILYFFDAVIPLDLNPGTLVYEVTARLRRGVTVTGQVLAHDGRPVASGLLLSPTYIPVGYELQGHTFPVRDGRFTLPGCDPEKSVPVLFFDPKGGEGAVMEMPPNRSSGEPVVRLAPCGAAAFRCLDADGKAMRNPPMRLYALLRPGAPVQESIDRGVDPALVVQWTQVGGVSCASLDTQDGTMTFSNLIPGATYLVQVDDTFGFTPRASITVQPGQRLPLQNVTLKRPKK